MRPKVIVPEASLTCGSCIVALVNYAEAPTTAKAVSIAGQYGMMCLSHLTSVFNCGRDELYESIEWMRIRAKYIYLRCPSEVNRAVANLSHQTVKIIF